MRGFACEGGDVSGHYAAALSPISATPSRSKPRICLALCRRASACVEEHGLPPQ